MRSRAAYKLMEIDDKAAVPEDGARVVDLGAAPGGWAQVARQARARARRQGRVIGMDLLDMRAFVGASSSPSSISRSGGAG